MYYSKVLLVKKLWPLAVAPERQSEYAAGYDLSSGHDITIPKRSHALVPTGISLAIPSGCYGRIAPRSGLALKFGIDVGAGVIDWDYRGEIKVLLFNHSDEDFHVNVNDRIAQLILEKIETPQVIIVEELPETLRGDKGFGSTKGYTSKP
jgi:dUTP pyrophosphatase